MSGRAFGRALSRRGRLTLLAASGLGTLLFCGTAPLAAELSFERHEVVTWPAERQTVVAGFFLDRAMADLAVVERDEDGQPRLTIFAFADGGWARSREASLNGDVQFVDVAAIAGRDRLIAYEPGRLSWLDPESLTKRELVGVTSGFDRPRQNEIPHVDVTRDLNQDGLDDLVVPGVGGFQVFIQVDDGSFAEPVRIGPPADLAGIYGADGYRYDPWSQSRVFEIDYNLDGRGDLAFWNEDRFEVHVQDEQGLFAAAPGSFTTDVAFDSDDLYSLATGDLTGRVLHSLADLDGDGVADLVVAALEGATISNKRSAYEVHLGRPTPAGGTAFAPSVDLAFRSDGRVLLGLERHDFDRDGQTDLLLTAIDVEHLQGSLWKSFKGFMGDDVRLDLEFYRLDRGRYPESPSAARELALDGPPSHREPGWVPLEILLRGATHEGRRRQRVWPRAFNNSLLVGDVTGDGLAEVILGGHPRALTVLVAAPGPGLFAEEAEAISVAVPNDEEYIWLVDLDRDGRQDLLLHHPFTARDGHGTPLREPGTEPHRVTMLIAR